MSEPRGVKLILSIQNELRKIFQRHDAASNELDKLNEEVERAKSLQHDIDYTVWHYLRERLRAPFPGVNSSLGHIRTGETLGDYTVGRSLGGGSTGTVYRLMNAAEPEQRTGRVVRVLQKKHITSRLGLSMVASEIKVLKVLSSDEWRHRNIIEMFKVYHSPYEVVIELQDAGSWNLWRYLRTFDRRQLPLGIGRTLSLIQQCFAAITHMHLGPRVAHRDIKPENVVIRENPNGVDIQFIDFDLATFSRPNRLSSTTCGTFPFIAPEMFT